MTDHVAGKSIVITGAGGGFGSLVARKVAARGAKVTLGDINLAAADIGVGDEADLASYLLFDGEFARRLIEVGRADARARHEELCRFFTDAAPP